MEKAVFWLVLIFVASLGCKGDQDFVTDGEYIKIKRSLFAVLIVFAVMVFALAVAIIRYLTLPKNRADDTTGSRKSSKVDMNKANGEVINRWSGLYRFTRAEIERAIDYASSRIHLGSGSAGQVYQDVLPSGQLVAIKHIHRTAMSGSFTREADGLVNVRHPNLVCLFGYCDDGDDKCWIIKQFSNYIIL